VRTHRLALAQRGGVVFVVGRPILGEARAVRAADARSRTPRWLAATASARSTRCGTRALLDMPGALSAAANPPRLIGWGSEPGSTRASDTLCRAEDRRTQELRSRAWPPAPVFRQVYGSSWPGPIPPPAWLGQNDDLGPRVPPVGLPSSLSTGRGCARSLCSSLGASLTPLSQRGSFSPAFLRRELSSMLDRLTERCLAAPAHPGGQDASPRRVHQSTYLTSTRSEPFDFLRLAGGGEGRA